MNIVISCDDNYILPARVMLESLSRYNKDVTLWFVYSDIREQNLETLSQDTKGYGWTFHAVKISAKIKEIAEKLPCHMHFSKEMYYRLFLPWILAECDKVLYLDCDMLVCGNLQKLYDTECDGKLAAAVYDMTEAIRKECIKRLGLRGDYYNSGMQLLWLERIRAHLTMEQMADEIEKNASSLPLIYPDQDLFNKIYDEKIKSVARAYNYNAQTNGWYKLTHLREVRQAVIVHFITNYKPWHNNYHSFYYLFEYWPYLKKYLSKDEQKQYWRGKHFVGDFVRAAKNYILKRVGKKSHAAMSASKK